MSRFSKTVREPKKLTPEGVVIRQVRDGLRAYGWYVIRIQQSLGCHKGISDLIAVKDGITLWVECKAPKGTISEHQKKFKQAVEQQGQVYIEARGFEDVERVIKNLFIYYPALDIEIKAIKGMRVISDDSHS